MKESSVLRTLRCLVQADDLKSQGNAALADGRVDEALSLYGEAIALQPDSHVLYSNRSAAYCKSKRYAEALTDAEKVNELKPDWAKVGRRLSQLGYFSVSCGIYGDNQFLFSLLCQQFRTWGEGGRGEGGRGNEPSYWKCVCFTLFV